MQRLINLFSIAFVTFIVFIIYLANTGHRNPIFSYVATVPNGDKIMHFSMFGILSLALNFSFKCRTLPFRWFPLYWGSACVLFFAGLEELSQGWLATRTMDMDDFVADLWGIGVATVLTYLIQLAGRVFHRPPTE